MKRQIGLLLAVGMLISMSAATAQSASYDVPFGDSVLHWSGWGNGLDDGNDIVFSPNLASSGGYATISDTGYLTSVKIDYWKDHEPQSAASLFVDVGADTTWDYVLQPALTNLNTANTIYQLSLPLNDPNYIMSNSFHSNIYLYREDHPVAIDPTQGTALGGFTLQDFIAGSGSGQVEFSLADGLVNLGGQDFILGFGPTCANDVIYETINNPVPIPTSLLLFGSGLMGLAGIKSRKKERGVRK